MFPSVDSRRDSVTISLALILASPAASPRGSAILLQ